MENFDKIIMNPPYNRSLHLKILRQVMNKADEVVNLSPIRWLQDPLAEMKGNRADYGRFADIRSKITSLEVVDGKEANGLFGIDTLLDLGIYYLTGEGGFDTKNFWKQFKNPLVEKMITKLTILDNLSNHYQANCLDGIRVPITKIGGNRGYKPVYKDLDYVIDGKKNGKDWTKCKNMGGYEKPENSPLPLSVKFDTEEEAKNFYKFFFSKIGTWICNITHCQQNIQFNLIPYLPDYTHPWTDEMLYEYFGLTDSEIQEIEQVVDLGIYYLTPEGGLNITPKPFISQGLFDKVNKPTYEGRYRSINTVRTAEGKPNYTRPFVRVPNFYGNDANAKSWSFVISPNREIAMTPNKKSSKVDATVNFNTQEEADNFFNYLQTKFVRACNANVKTNIRNPAYAIPYMEDYTHPWTNEMLYEYFGLTDSEIQEIEQVV